MRILVVCKSSLKREEKGRLGFSLVVVCWRFEGFQVVVWPGKMGPLLLFAAARESCWQQQRRGEALGELFTGKKWKK